MITYCARVPVNDLFIRPVVISKRHTLKTDVFYIETILNTVCRYFEITVYELKSPSRKRVYTDARYVAIYLVNRYVPKYSLKKLGEIFGGRDHSTIIYSINKFNDLHNSNNIFRLDYEKIKLRLNSYLEDEEAA